MTPLLKEVESTHQINDQIRLDQAGNACIDHPAGDLDSHGADDRERTAGRHNDPGQAIWQLECVHLLNPELHSSRNNYSLAELGSIRRFF